ncbi:MAG TPA: formyltransferase family protein [Flavobacterium sp.]|jgi:methionyl-tRNA formyltransferase|nr:formyltransferase family protein [Flavobacterium sp.]HPJ10969.1 formyltransferase family protein [Flavobacterium sp.]
MKRIFLAGFGQPLIDLYESLKGRFDIVGVILDYERRAKFPLFYDFLASQKLGIYSFEDRKNIVHDGTVVINYNKIITIDQVSPVLNIHMGLLPVYRGNNANAWALLNGDRTVGYTLHEVSEVLDGGAIYYTFGYEIQDHETYFHAKNAMSSDIKTKLPSVIQDVLEGKITGTSQENHGFIYAAKLIPEDGIITNWNLETSSIVNRNMIFSRPLGTGLKLLHEGTLLEISKLSTIPNYLNSNGIPGAVVLKNSDGSVWVKTKDTAISLDELVKDGQAIKPADIFKIGQRL